MRKVKRRGRNVVVPDVVLAWMLLASHSRALARNPSLEVSQYGDLNSRRHEAGDRS